MLFFSHCHSNYKYSVSSDPVALIAVTRERFGFFSALTHLIQIESSLSFILVIDRLKSGVLELGGAAVGTNPRFKPHLQPYKGIIIF